MTLLYWLERLSKLPAEAWLVPPVVILATMAVVSLVLRRVRLRRFHAIAERARLSVKERIMDGSEVRGAFRGRPLVMTLASSRRPTFRKRWTRVTVDVKNPEVITLRLWRQGLLDNLIISAGAKELQIGDAEFDRRFVIQSGDAALVTKMFQNRELRDDIVRADIDRVNLLSSKLEVYYAREERDPEHAALLFTAAARLAEGIDAMKGDYKPEIIRTERR
jgi:hypothetical protein